MRAEGRLGALQGLRAGGLGAGRGELPEEDAQGAAGEDEHEPSGTCPLTPHGPCLSCLPLQHHGGVGAPSIVRRRGARVASPPAAPPPVSARGGLAAHHVATIRTAATGRARPAFTPHGVRRTPSERRRRAEGQHPPPPLDLPSRVHDSLRAHDLGQASDDHALLLGPPPPRTARGPGTCPGGLGLHPSVGDSRGQDAKCEESSPRAPTSRITQAIQQGDA